MTRTLSPWRNRWVPFGELADVDHLIDRFLRMPSGETPAERFAPSINIVESDSQFEVTADLPGFAPEDVHVEVHEGELTVSGNRKSESEEEGKTYHRMERTYGEFRRVVVLPSEIDHDKINAEFKHGVLTVTLPKIEKTVPRKIEIKGN